MDWDREQAAQRTNTYKIATAVCGVVICLLLAGYIVFAVVMVRSAPVPRVCNFVEGKPQVYFIGVKTNSWIVEHNVGYFNLRPPHVEVGASMISKYRVGNMFDLDNPHVSGRSVQWEVLGCTNNKTGVENPCHFTVYYANDIACYVDGTREGLGWDRC